MVDRQRYELRGEHKDNGNIAHIREYMNNWRKPAWL